MELHASERPAAMQHGERGTSRLVVGYAVGGIVPAGQAVGHGGMPAFRVQALHARVVRAGDENAVRRQTGEELFKGRLDVRHVVEVIKMVVVDVADERDGRRKRQEALHIFARLGEEQVASAHANAALQRVHVSADVDGRIRIRRLRDERQCGIAAAYAHHLHR